MNETIKTQLNHRSIRQFKPVALTQDEVNLLVDVARHTSTSNFRQAYSIISKKRLLRLRISLIFLMQGTFLYLLWIKDVIL